MKTFFRLNSRINNLLFILSLTVILIAGGCKDNAVVIEGLDDLANPAVQPRIISTTPSQNSTGPFNIFDWGDGSGKPHFVLVFNKFIDKSSISSKSVRVMGFDRPVAAYLKSNYYYYGPDKRGKNRTPQSDYYDYVLAFGIYDSTGYGGAMSYRIGQTYTVILDGSIQDINGNHLSGNYSFSFLPEPYFRVAGFFPKNYATDVDIYTSPLIIFNSPVDQNILANIQLSPQPAGAWKLTQEDSSFSVAYHPLQSTYPFSTTYTILVNSFAQDVYHHQIHQPYNSTYSIIPFKVISTFPRMGQSRTSPDGYIEIRLSGSMDTGTVRNAFSIFPTTIGSFNMTTWYSTSYFDFLPSIGLKQNTTYTINVGSNLKAFDGTPLTPFTMTFTTDRFRIYSTNPYDGSSDVYRNTGINISTNAKIDTASARSCFSISPAINGYVSNYDWPNSFFFAHDQLAANTTYTVTLSTVLRTKAGDNLSSPYSFTFTTGSN